MADSVRDDAGGRRQKTLPGRGAMKPAKAQLRPDIEPEVDGRRFREVAADALRRMTSQKAAALAIGISEGRLSTKLQDGSLTLRQLEALGLEYAVQLAHDVLVAYGASAKSSKQRARERLPEMLREILELTA